MYLYSSMLIGMIRVDSGWNANEGTIFGTNSAHVVTSKKIHPPSPFFKMRKYPNFGNFHAFSFHKVDNLTRSSPASVK